MRKSTMNSRKRKRECEVKISVRFAEPFWRAVGFREIEMIMKPASRADELLAALRKQYPILGIEFDQTPPHVFIGDVEAPGDTLLTDGAQIHLVWPIAGG